MERFERNTVITELTTSYLEYLEDDEYLEHLPLVKESMGGNIPPTANLRDIVISPGYFISLSGNDRVVQITSDNYDYEFDEVIQRILIISFKIEVSPAIILRNFLYTQFEEEETRKFFELRKILVQRLSSELVSIKNILERKEQAKINSIKTITKTKRY